MKKKVGVISLGCDKNRVDTENMLYYLAESGYELTQKREEAEVIVVNTCAFLQSAREEAIDTVLECAALRPEKLLVTGCLPQKYVCEIFADLPEVDAFLGISDYARIGEVLDRLYAEGGRINAVGERGNALPGAKRILTTPYHYAYLKIAEGCSNHCTYCTIPSIRGKYVSRDFDEIVKEAEGLAESGVRELILVAQDTAKYGVDRYGERRLSELIRALSEISGIAWIRLLYCYPEDVTAELVEELSRNPKLVKYVDLPLQHASDGILKRMARRCNRAGQERLIRELRERVPGIAIRSTFIVGFPGESSEDFEELLDFLAEQKLDNAGFFAYSPEEGTPAAKFPGQVPEKVKRERLEECYRAQREISRRRCKSLVGKVLTAVCDGVDFEGEAFYGRTQGMAPDVDGKLYLRWDKPIAAGGFYEVAITGGNDYDLFGEICHELTE